MTTEESLLGSSLQTSITTNSQTQLIVEETCEAVPDKMNVLETDNKCQVV